jgi:hypothetical protein
MMPPLPSIRQRLNTTMADDDNEHTPFFYSRTVMIAPFYLEMIHME